MRTPRDVFRFKNALAELQELASAQNAKESDVENIELTAEQICEVEKFRCGELRHTQLSRTVSMWLSFESLNTRRKNPIFFSDLPVLLEQETWSPNDALLILAGVDPRGAVLDWNTENHLGAETGRPQIKHAIWFTSTSDLYDYPVPEDFENSAKDYENATQDLIENKSSTQEVQKLLKRADDWKKWSNDKTSIFKSKTLALRSELVYILKRRWESGDHDPSIRRTPMFFVRWAEARGFEIEWAPWAREHGYIEITEEATAPPFFDADSEDYPELLHIAVRAWDHARHQTSATPKKRILAFVTERYPHISDGAKDAIALIANWQKMGGRPKSGG